MSPHRNSRCCLLGIVAGSLLAFGCATRPERPPAERIRALPFSEQELDVVATFANEGELTFVERIAAGGDRTVLVTKVEAPPSLVREVVLDADAYDAFVPQVVSSETLEASKTRRRIELEIEVPLSNFVYQLDYDSTEPDSVNVSCSEGAFEGSQWRWDFLPLDDGSSTLLSYSSAMRIGNSNLLLNQILAFHPDMETGFSFSSGLALIRAMKTEAERRTADRKDPADE